MKEESTIESAQPKNKNNKGLKIVTIVMSILALAGVGFGIYGMLQSFDKDRQISDLKVQVKNSNGTTTTLKTPEVSTTTEDGTTVTISDSATTLGLSPVIMNSNIEGSTDMSYVLSLRQALYSNGSTEEKEWVISSHEGELHCGVMKSGSNNVVDECDLSAHSGKVANIQKANIGNGIMQYILITTDAGEIEYFNDDPNGDYRVLKKLNLPKKVSQIYTNAESEAHAGGGSDALIIYTDGQIVPLSKVLN